MRAVIVAVAGFASVVSAAELPEKVEFNKHIRPLLSDRCFLCHGPDSSTREAELRLDLRDEAVKERDGVIAIVPGKPDGSEAILRIFSDDGDEVMPPPKSKLPPLTAEEKALFKKWVEQGAEYQPHWAFVPLPEKVAVPEVKEAAWARSDLDRFILTRLEAEKLTHAPEASRERWLRRATFDLIGLPPTQAEIDTFLADGSPDAYEKVADRLLSSPRFGERMAVPWLDAARYADSFGYQADADTEAWPYRDWVIRALNENLPWDQFITWQLAGDLLPNATRDQKLATAFNRIHRKTNEGGSVPEEFLQDGISDRIHTVGTTFMALTFECARCHDHKYDPISMKEYYSIGAFFNSIDEFGLIQGGANKGLVLPQPAMPLPSPEQEQKLSEQRLAIEKQERVQREWAAQNEADFQRWLGEKPKASLPDLVGLYSLDEVKGGKTANAVSDKQPASTSDGNVAIEGSRGKALKLNGDDPISLADPGVRHFHDPVSFAFWLQPGEAYPQAVVFSNTTSFDKPYNGYELLLENGQLRWTWMKEFPGTAASVRSIAKVPVGEWTHVAVTYDGSTRASGLGIYINGKRAQCDVIRDGLTRDVRVGEKPLFGARGRDFGIRNGAVDEIHVFKRAITPAEVAHIHDGNSLDHLLAKTERSPEEIASLREYYFSAIHPGARQVATNLLAVRSEWRKALEAVEEIPVMVETAVPRPAYVLARGAYDAPTERVERVTPAALTPFPRDAPRNRLGFAQWLTSKDHPLTTRVLMNRLWQEFFGRGLVSSSENFGVQGAQPSHPELLDWLARDFIAHKWDYKRACRQIVLSATYRQESRAAKEVRERDPENILLARGPMKRLSAEQLRDSALALGGLLSPKIGGPPVHPYQPEGSMWKALNNFLPEYKADTGEGLWRRSMYTFWRRTTTPPNMLAFDAPTREVCAVKRQLTSTPLQPLVLLNDPQFVEAGRALGERMLRSGGSTPEQRVAWAYREVTGRAPSDRELPELQKLYAEQRAAFAGDPANAEKLLKVGEHKPDAKFPATELAAAATTASALLNLDAAFMLR